MSITFKIKSIKDRLGWIKSITIIKLKFRPTVTKCLSKIYIKLNQINNYYKNKHLIDDPQQFKCTLHRYYILKLCCRDFSL